MSAAGSSRRKRFILSIAEICDRLRHRRQCSLKHIPDLFVAGLFGKNAMAGDDSARISVHYENRMIAGVQQDRVGSFRADAMQTEKFFPQIVRRTRK